MIFFATRRPGIAITLTVMQGEASSENFKKMNEFVLQLFVEPYNNSTKLNWSLFCPTCDVCSKFRSNHFSLNAVVLPILKSFDVLKF